jgi:hypothetical protein
MLTKRDIEEVLAEVRRNAGKTTLVEYRDADGNAMLAHAAATREGALAFARNAARNAKNAGHWVVWDASGVVCHLDKRGRAFLPDAGTERP